MYLISPPVLWLVDIEWLDRRRSIVARPLFLPDDRHVGYEMENACYPIQWEKIRERVVGTNRRYKFRGGLVAVYCRAKGVVAMMHFERLVSRNHGESERASERTVSRNKLEINNLIRILISLVSNLRYDSFISSTPDVLLRVQSPSYC